MLDFKMGQVLGMMAKTAPFIIFRLVVYFSVMLAYVLSVGVGAGGGAGWTGWMFSRHRK